MRHEAAELPLAADRADTSPLTSQVAGQIRDAIGDGRLAAGERLPSTRALAAVLSVSRTVVTGAYAQLFAEGWIEGRHGSGTYVSAGAPGATSLDRGPGASEPDGAQVPGVPGTGDGLGRAGFWPNGGLGEDAAALDAELSEDLPQASGDVADLRPGIPWVPGIDRAAWRRAWRSVGLTSPLGRADPAGLPELRGALTGYLRRSRGFRCTPDQVLLTRGVTAALSLLTAGLLGPGDVVGVEEPGYPRARDVLSAHGAQVVPCRVDAHGLVVEDLPPGLRLVYTTPAHQYPLGGRLPVPRRQALIEWARRNGTVIVEDDYDGEFRYDVAPLPPMYGLGPDVVVYLGTTSKTLTPALRLGWLVAEPGLVTRLAKDSYVSEAGPSELVQHAVLTLVKTGDLERHVRRMRHEYCRRRAVLVTALRACGGGVLLGDEAGMHVVYQTSRGAEALAADAWQRGVALFTLRRYFAGTATCEGLVLGYGAAGLADVTRACQVLAEVLRDP